MNLRQRLKRLIYPPSEQGVSHAESLRLVIVNTLTAGGALCAIVLAALYVSVGHHESVWMALIAFIICASSRYLVSRGWVPYILILMFLVDMVVFVQNQLFQGLVPNHLFFFATGTAPFVIFPPQRRDLATIACAMAFALWLVSLAFPNLLVSGRSPPSPDLVERATYVAWIASFAFTIVPSLLLFSLTKRYQDEFVAVQQSRVHSAKLVSLGEMAAGIAHEINNPLGVVCGKAEALLEELNETGSVNPQTARKQLEFIESNGRRISQIVQSLKSLARQSSQDPVAPTNFAHLITSTVQLHRGRFKEDGIQMHVSIPGDIMIMSRPSEIMQVITNILTNARDALLIKKDTDRLIEIRAETCENSVELTISNNGIMIEPAVVGRIFEPFFTTKPPNQGTGLGLSISMSIVNSHKGSLKVSSTPSKTDFILELPLRQVMS